MVCTVQVRVLYWHGTYILIEGWDPLLIKHHTTTNQRCPVTLMTAANSIADDLYPLPSPSSKIPILSICSSA